MAWHSTHPTKPKSNMERTNHHNQPVLQLRDEVLLTRPNVQVNSCHSHCHLTLEQQVKEVMLIPELGNVAVPASKVLVLV